MKIKQIRVGFMKTNCYILEKDNKVIIIDPGEDADKIEKELKNKKVLGVVITHYHYDHVGALSRIINKYKCNIYDYYSLEEKEYIIENFKFEVIFTPGHCLDSISLYFKEDKKYFTGDFLFKETVGRCDLPTSSFDEMKKSIEKIKKYPEGNVYPGHGSSTTLSHEIKYNPYF